jgi:hypothetical protein
MTMPRLLSRDQAHKAGTTLAVLRMTIGVLAWIAPSSLLRPWIGRSVASEQGGKLIARSLGARDLAIGAGAVLAERHDARARGWIEAGGLADTGDLLATLLAWKHLPKCSRWAVLVSIAGAIVAAGVIAPSMDAPR